MFLIKSIKQNPKEQKIMFVNAPRTFHKKLLLLLIIAVSTASCSMHFLSRYIVGEVRLQFGKVSNLTEVKKVEKK